MPRIARVCLAGVPYHVTQRGTGGQEIFFSSADYRPVRAGLSPDAISYRWSSAAARVGGEDPDRLLELGPWATEYTTERWREVLETSVGEEGLAQRIREATRRGRPLGEQEFVEGLERDAARRLRPRPVGRPRGAREEDPDTAAQLRLDIGI